MKQKLKIKLYVIEESPQSKRAVTSLKRICREQYRGNCDITIIDIKKDPHAAERDDIFATPTLIKLAPPPIRRILGDLSNTEKVLVALDLETGDT